MRGLLGKLIPRLGTMFTTPEEILLKQGEIGNELFFISRGDCVVNLRDHNNNYHLAIKLLVEGDLFGEISLLYNCSNTSEVISRNYNTIARISKPRLRMVFNEHPIFKKYLKRHSIRY
jgi:CRP-like cAMP-binding protein